MKNPKARPLRLGLALASGGCIGVSWEIGALEGLRRATGLDARDAEIVVGTSAGSFVGGVALSLGASLAYAYTAGEATPGAHHSPDDLARVARMDRHIYGGLLDRFPLDRRSLPRLGSLAGVRRMARGEGGGLAVAAAMLLPEGLLSIRKVGDALREITPAGWPSERLGVRAFDLDRAEPCLLSRADDHGVGFFDAVSASCAIPGVFAPLRVAGRRLADGGIWSAASLDVLAGRGLDLVICLHPLIGDPAPGLGMSLIGRMRARCQAQLADEARRLEREGTRVIILSPEPEERRAFPRNFLDVDERGPIMRRAARAVERRLRGGALASLLTSRSVPAPAAASAAARAA